VNASVHVARHGLSKQLCLITISTVRFRRRGDVYPRRETVTRVTIRFHPAAAKHVGLRRSGTKFVTEYFDGETGVMNFLGLIWYQSRT